MITRLKLSWFCLMVVTTLSVLPTAHAYYDPAAQRWLNRDPFDDSGFQRLRKFSGKRGYVREGENLYIFALNNTITGIDAFGLLKFDGSCSKEQRDAIEKGFTDGCDKAKKKNCFDKCKGHPGAGDKLCGNGADGRTFSCGSYGDGICGSKAVGKCGNTSDDYKTITVCPPVFEPDVGKNGCEGASCTVIHELVHTIGGKQYDHTTDPSDYDAAYEVEECLGCQGRNLKRPTETLPQPRI